MGTKLYIGNLDVRITADDLKALFTGAGRVVSTYIVTDRETGRSKGFAFIEMANETEARHAIALYSGHLLHDQALIVNEARPRENPTKSAPSSALPKFREIKHKRRGGGNIHRFG